VIFSSNVFIFGFMPLALLGFWVAIRIGRRGALLWLILVSLAFYSYWNIAFLPLLLISIAFNFTIGRVLARTEQRPTLQLWVLFVGIAADLLALIYFKYSVALATSLGFNTVAGTPFDDIILPLGISFFTFTQIGYLVDVKQGVAKSQDVLSYVLFVTFFPHLIAGPILHNREMIPQFTDPKLCRFDISNLAVGFTIFCIGLGKKVLLADPLSADVSLNFSHAGTTGLAIAWYSVVGYSLQLYFDFSGYSDMAIGLARIFNIRFPMNFNSPYKATTVIEYWQRFHMTLTRFITMYIFTPLAMWVTQMRASRGLDNSRQASRTPNGFLTLVIGPTLVTMLLAGVWHGAGLQYFIFGTLHGLYITINHAFRTFIPKKKGSPATHWLVAILDHMWKVLAVYIAVLIAFVFFRAASTTQALQLLSGMLGLHGLSADPGSGLTYAKLGRLVILFGIVWGLPNTQQIMSRYEPTLGRPIPNPFARLNWNPTYGWAILTGVLAALSLMDLGSTTEFLYFQF